MKRYHQLAGALAAGLVLLAPAFASADTPPRTASEKRVVAFLDLAFNRKQPKEAFARFGGPYYRQHNPTVPDGRDAILAALGQWLPGVPNLRYDIKRVVSSGDLVVVHSHVTTSAGDRGMALSLVVRVAATGRHLPPGERQDRRALGRRPARAGAPAQRQHDVLSARPMAPGSEALGRFDYIIVGGGTAGCVLASRLTEDAAVRVLLLEAGPEPRSLWIRMPAGMGRLFVNPRYNWGYLTDPEPHLGDRRMYVPQGMTLGGSSAINGMAYVRGHREDYDGWRDRGAAGWGWSDVEPYFRRQERRSAGEPGPLTVSSPTYRHPSSEAFVDAGVALGLPRNAAYNGPVQEGVSFLQYTMRRGERQSSADAYLRAARWRPNLAVLTGARAQRLLLRDGRAIGVAFTRGGSTEKAWADREVILSGGAFGSPRLLLNSGIGPADDLRRLGIPVAANLPGVGENLVDHPYVHMTFTTRPAQSLNGNLRGWRVWLNGARWLLARSGPLTIGASQAVAFVRGLPDAARPDLQINFRPISHAFDENGRLAADPVPRVTAAICALRPGSAGRLRLRSADPDEPPEILGNYLDDPRDEDTLVAGVAWVRRLFDAAPLQALSLGEAKPGPGFEAEAAVRRFVRATTQTMCHPVGTCRMGADELAVVDPRLRVRGVRNLRVVDISVAPTIVSGNTAAAAFMIGERGADLIRGDRQAG